jgi:hypothetical protein
VSARTWLIYIPHVNRLGAPALADIASLTLAPTLSSRQAVKVKSRTAPLIPPDPHNIAAEESKEKKRKKAKKMKRDEIDDIFS